MVYIVEPLIKDTPNKEHLSIKDKSTRPIPIIPLHFNLRIKETSLLRKKFLVPTCPFSWKFHCIHIDLMTHC